MQRLRRGEDGDRFSSVLQGTVEWEKDRRNREFLGFARDDSSVGILLKPRPQARGALGTHFKCWHRSRSMTSLSVVGLKSS